ncbi:MAG TPA: MlaD family protein, partial [Candidatus Angelobacter sp.]|nr:MlaD family protein [Candidatus Angelobacter sp.]
MALQDLTPQLRTRLSRMERTVGWFVFLATALLLFGFGYYLYHTAENKGWFKIKVQFHTYVQSSAGLSVGDKVFMMGFPVGEITMIKAMPPRDLHNVRIEFQIVDPYFRYIWTGGSVVKVNAASFLGRQL